MTRFRATEDDPGCTNVTVLPAPTLKLAQSTIIFGLDCVTVSACALALPICPVPLTICPPIGSPAECTCPGLANPKSEANSVLAQSRLNRRVRFTRFKFKPVFFSGKSENSYLLVTVSKGHPCSRVAVGRIRFRRHISVGSPSKAGIQKQWTVFVFDTHSCTGTTLGHALATDVCCHTSSVVKHIR